MRRLLSLALTLSAAAPLIAQTPPPQQSVATAPPDVAQPPANAARTPSGLASRVLTPGTGQTHPGKSDLVTVHYTGWKTDGAMLDSSVLRGKPATLLLDRVIPGWTEGVQLMVEGEKRRFWIPDAYKGQPTRPQGMMVFDIELISFAPSPTQPPPDVKAPPSDAKRTASGLAYKVLRAGAGTRHPLATSMVTVHYSGWTTDGKLFDSSVAKGQPLSFSLSGVIKGWTEGVQLMVVGEKVRFWIPDTLAYKDDPTRPQGMLVFDIELLDVK